MALSDLKMYRSPLLDFSCHRVGDRMSESSGPGARVAGHLSHSSGTPGFLLTLSGFVGLGAGTIQGTQWLLCWSLSCFFVEKRALGLSR